MIHRFELHYSDGIRGVLKGNSAEKLINEISMKPMKEWALYKNDIDFHSTADEKYLVKWWGKGSYWDNMSKSNPELLKKKYNGYQQSTNYITVGDTEESDRLGDDPSSKQYFDKTIKKESKSIKNILELLEKAVIKEGTWSYPDTAAKKIQAKRALKELEAWKKKYYSLLGDDELYDGIDNAIKRGKYLINYKED